MLIVPSAKCQGMVAVGSEEDTFFKMSPKGFDEIIFQNSPLTLPDT